MDGNPRSVASGIFLSDELRRIIFFILRATFRLRRRLMGKTVSAMSLQRTKQYEIRDLRPGASLHVGKVCYLYAMDSDDFDDLYQEVLINLWRGFDGFEGRAKVSSWVYRVALNTCISYYRRNRRHTGRAAPDRLAGRSRRRFRTRRAVAGAVCADKPARCARKGARDAVARRASLRGDRRDHGAYAQQRGFEAPPHQAETA